MIIAVPQNFWLVYYTSIQFLYLIQSLGAIVICPDTLIMIRIKSGIKNSAKLCLQILVNF